MAPRQKNAAMKDVSIIRSEMECAEGMVHQERGVVIKDAIMGLLIQVSVLGTGQRRKGLAVMKDATFRLS